MIFGKDFDWSDVSVALPTGISPTITNIDYNDNSEVEAVYGRGSMPIAYGRGKYSAEGKLTLAPAEAELLKAALATTGLGRLHKSKPFNITISYAQDEAPIVTDELLQCVVKKWPKKAASGDKNFTVELDFIILGGIIWNGIPGDSNE